MKLGMIGAARQVPSLDHERREIGDRFYRFTTILAVVVSIVVLGFSEVGPAQAPPVQTSEASSSSANSVPLLSSDLNAGEPDGVAIRSWYMVGPFDERIEQGSSAPQLDVDYLTNVHLRENDVTTGNVSALCAKGDECQVHTSDGPVINLLKIFPLSPDSVLYAVAILSSPSEQYVGLQYDVSFSAKVWVNGEMIDAFRSSTRHPIAMYQHFVPLHLKSGSNLLVIKTDQGSLGAPFEPWGIVASIIPMSKMWAEVVSTRDGFLLENRQLQSGDPLGIPLLNNSLMLDRSQPIRLTVVDHAGAAVFSKAISTNEAGIIAVPPLKSGFYSARLIIGSDNIEDSFYIGDTDALYQELEAAQSATPKENGDYSQRDAIIKRWNILTSPKYELKDDANWQKKFMFVLGEAVEALAVNSENPWYKRPGQHLREYTSDLDGGVYNYLLDIPDDADPAMGLVVIMPYAVATQRPFLESAFISYSVVLDQIKYAARQSHVAVAVLGSNTEFGNSPEGEARTMEVLRDIAINYHIDPARLYLYGVSEGGRRALLLAEHHPDLFAAVGVWGPMLNGNGGDVGVQDPIALASAIADTPVALLKGQLDAEVPDQTFLGLSDELKKLGNDHVIVQIVPNAMHDPMRVEKMMFPLLTEFRNRLTANSIEEVTAKMIGGALAERTKNQSK